MKTITLNKIGLVLIIVMVTYVTINIAHYGGVCSSASFSF
jgi:hypothetical protein